MKPKAPNYPVGLGILAAGLVALVATAILSLHFVGRFNTRGHYITVPAAVTLEVDPNETIIILRELAGAHNTVNHPVQPPPDDLAITVTAAGQPVPTQPSDWWMRQSLFGLDRERKGVARFTSPADGRVEIDVQGSFDLSQIYYVGPSFDLFERTHGRYLTAMLMASVILCVAGLALLVWRAASSSRIEPGLLGDEPLQ